MTQSRRWREWQASLLHPTTLMFALFVVALAPRLYVALAWAGEPVWDGHYYDFGARRIAAGLGYSDDLVLGDGKMWHPWCHYPVGYSAYLALFYKLLGPSRGVLAAVNATTSALLPLVTMGLARHAMSRTRAFIAGALVAVHPGLILYAALTMTEPLAALLTTTAFWIAVARRGLSGVVLGALLLGLSALVRPQALLCVPFLVVALRPRGPHPSGAPLAAPEGGNLADAGRRTTALLRPWLLAAGLCLVSLLPVLPWTARNCRVMDACALVSTNAGWNLAIGAFPRATGRFETLRASDGCREVTGQVQQDRCWFSFGLAEIRRAPLRWLSLVPRKLGFTFDHESFPVEYLREGRPSAWPEARRVAARDVLTMTHRMLLFGAALGCAAVARRGARSQVVLLGVLCVGAALAWTSGEPSFWPLAVWTAVVPWLPIPGRPRFAPAMLLGAALLGTTILTHAVFFGEDRYHVVASPILCLFAAAALRRPS